MRSAVRGLVCVAIMVAMAGQVQAGVMQLVTNGGFETGDFTGWTPVSIGSALGFQINDGSQDPAGPAMAQPPISGNFDTFSSQTGPGQNNIFSQSINLPTSFVSATLSWSDRIQNFANFSDPNQEFRMSLVDSIGNPISTIFSANPGDPLVQLGPNNRSFDVTSLIQPFAGQGIGIRFEQQDNLGFFNATIDNVSLEVQSEVIPEPTSLAIFGFGAMGMIGIRRRRKRPA